MEHCKSITTGSLGFLLVVLSFIMINMAHADCVQSDPEANLVFAIDANNGCADIEGQFGCNIKDAADGSCTYTADDGRFFTVISTVTTDGNAEWWLDPASTLGVDTAIVGGGSRGKNNCGYNYRYDVTSGTGGDCKNFNSDGSCATYQNVTSLDVCTDLENDTPPPPPEEPPVAMVQKACQTQDDFLSGVNGQLDETGIQCPILTDDEGSPILDPETGEYQQARVIVCNLEVDKYAFGTIGANDANREAQEDVCCKCGITDDTACFISEDKATNLSEDGTIDLDTGCTVETTSDPTQEVVLQFQKDRGTDPCQKIRSGGKVYKTCW